MSALTDLSSENLNECKRSFEAGLEEWDKVDGSIHAARLHAIILSREIPQSAISGIYAMLATTTSELVSFGKIMHLLRGGEEGSLSDDDSRTLRIALALKQSERGVAALVNEYPDGWQLSYARTAFNNHDTRRRGTIEWSDMHDVAVVFSEAAGATPEESAKAALCIPTAVPPGGPVMVDFETWYVLCTTLSILYF